MNANLTYRLANKSDIPKIVDMLLDDPLEALREKADVVVGEAYYRAYDIIRADANQELTIVELNVEISAILTSEFRNQRLNHSASK